jgi:rifampicin phosphotransferase
VVGGQVTPDHFIVDRHDFHVRSAIPGTKEVMVVPGTDGIATTPVKPEAQRKVSLSSNQLIELAKLAMDVEQHYAGVHQDIEWAFADGKLWLLQSRPITKLPPPPIVARWEPPFPGAYLIRRGWVEHLLGPISPLFESIYLERGLEDAYQKREGSLGFKKRLPKPRHTTVNGWAYGRYGPQTPVLQNRFQKWFHGYWMLIDLVISYRFSWLLLWRYWGLPLYLSRIRRWKKVVPRSASVETLYLGLRSLADADAEYWVHASRIQGLSKVANQRMTSFLADHAPDANFFVRTVGDVKLQTSTDLLSGYPSKSNDALGEVARIAANIQVDSALSRLVLITPVSRLMAALESNPIGYKTAAAINAYLDQYGHQTFTLDFVEPTQLEAPAAMLSNLKAMVAGTGAIDPMAAQAETERRRKNTANEAMGYFEGPIRRQFARRYRLDTRDSRHREDAMFYMGAAWAVLRPLARELGQRLVDAGSLTVAEDIFYITNDELLIAIEPLVKAAPGRPPNRFARRATSMVFGVAPIFGVAPKSPGTTSAAQKSKAAKPDLAIPGLKEKAQAQKQLREARKRLHPPAALPESYMESVKDILTQQITNNVDSEVIDGFATSAGTITAPASVLFSPEDFDKMVPGSILVCPFTTPAWTQLFTQASGLVTDIGGIGGHGSIVAREYGIPAVMGTGIGTQCIVHGQVITVDGDAGTVSLGPAGA